MPRNTSPLSAAQRQRAVGALMGTAAGDALGAGQVLQGPLIIEEHTTTLYAGPDDQVTVDSSGNYLIALR